jgi:hypothetical protein
VGEWGVGSGVWGVGEWGVGRREWGEGRINKNNLLSPESCLLNPIVDVGFLQEFYFLTKISKSYLLTAKT